MGAWGVGLYSSDFAMDLRSCVKAVARLPFEPDRLLDAICSTEPAASANTRDEDHTVFWLTVADQFAKRGIHCPRARDMALGIVADGADLAAMAALGMDEKSLARRRAMLDDLHSRIVAPVAVKPRAVLKKPQQFLLEVGEVLIYPVSQSVTYFEPINPFTVGKVWPSVTSWKQAGWGAFAIVERGLLFDFIAWYRPVVVNRLLTGEPTMAKLSAPRPWILRQSGTLTARCRENLQLKAVGRIDVDPAKREHFFPDLGVPVGPVVSDISIAGSLDFAVQERSSPYINADRKTLHPRLDALADIEPGDGANGKTLSGCWRGNYTYDDGQAVGSFRADCKEISGLLRGRTADDPSATDKPGRPHDGVIEGRRDGRSVRFFKRYVSATKRYVPIEYVGELDENGERMEGRWSIQGGRAGGFAMTRVVT